MKLQRKLLATALLSGLAAPAFADIAIDKWGIYDVSFKGLIQADYNDFNADVAALEDDADLRRAELVLQGKAENSDWVIGYDADADKWLDVNYRQKFGSHSLRFGQFKQPNSLEELASSTTMDFMSRSMVANNLSVSRRLGVGYGYESGNITLNASAFGRELTSNRGYGDGFGVRATYAPINSDGNVFHLGASFVDYDTQNDAARIRARPADLANLRLIDTGTMANSTGQSTIGLESIWAAGPFKLQAEWMQSDVNRSATPDFTAEGGYVSGVWNMTGEGWNYKSGGIKPGSAKDANRGLWQLALRYDVLDLDDGLVQGGVEKDLTLGVNYYWRKNFKVMANYVKVDSERMAVSDNPDIVEFRFQFHF